MLKRLNRQLHIEQTPEQTVLIAEKRTSFADISFIALRLPRAITETQYEELSSESEACQGNPPALVSLSLEWNGNDIIYIKMGTFGIISAIIAAVISELYTWANREKQGRVYAGNGIYQITNFEQRRVAASYISYEHVPEAEQKKWAKSYITSPPTLVVEVVSAKGSLKHELAKMKNYWMASGAYIGVVVCPFSKSLYIFEHGKRRRTQSIYKPFTHKLLPDYTGDFSTYADKV